MKFESRKVFLWLVPPQKKRDRLYRLITEKGVQLKTVEASSDVQACELVLGYPRSDYLAELRKEYGNKYTFFLAIARGEKREIIVKKFNEKNNQNIC